MAIKDAIITGNKRHTIAQVKRNATILPTQSL